MVFHGESYDHFGRPLCDLQNELHPERELSPTGVMAAKAKPNLSETSDRTEPKRDELNAMPQSPSDSAEAANAQCFLGKSQPWSVFP